MRQEVDYKNMINMILVSQPGVVADFFARCTLALAEGEVSSEVSDPYATPSCGSGTSFEEVIRGAAGTAASRRCRSLQGRRTSPRLALA